MSPQARRAIDRYAMERVTALYRGKGYDVEDVSLRQSYDLRCTKGASTLHVEVKGTQTLGRSVLLTKNEIAFMRERHPNPALVVVHSIVLPGSNEAPVATGGDLREIQPWEIRDEDLEAITFGYTIGKADSD